MVVTKAKIKEIAKKILEFIFNPRLLLCLGIAWFITNGWCYVFIAVGKIFDIDWMFGVGLAYFVFLYMPSPEKILTVAIAIFLLKTFFPNDTKTLAVLRDMQKSIKDKISEIRSKKAKKKEERKNRKNIKN